MRGLSQQHDSEARVQVFGKAAGDRSLPESAFSCKKLYRLRNAELRKFGNRMDSDLPYLYLPYWYQLYIQDITS